MSDGVEVTVHPPDSLLKYEAPVFVGLEPSKAQEPRATDPHTKEGASQLEDMMNSMLAPR